MLSDVGRLGCGSDSFTYLSEAHGTTSWIDHCVCRSTYMDKCAELLGSIELPQNAVCCSNTSCKDVSHIEGTKDLYCCIVNALHTAALIVIPVTRASGTADDHNIPGWNDIIKAVHSDARDAFKFWVRSNKPRHVDVFDSMRVSRAKFK